MGLFDLPNRWMLILVGIPTIFIILYFFDWGINELLLSKPSKTDLVGTYHITEVTIEPFDTTNIANYKLTLKADGTYTITSIPQLGICEHGKYDINYSDDR